MKLAALSARKKVSSKKSVVIEKKKKKEQRQRLTVLQDPVLLRAQVTRALVQQPRATNPGL